MTGYAGSRDYVGNLKSSWRTPHWSQNPPEKDDPAPLVGDFDPLVASSVWLFCAWHSQREGRSLPGQVRDHIFQWDVGISVGFSTGTTGSLRNPESRRTPSIVIYVLYTEGMDVRCPRWGGAGGKILTLYQYKHFYYIFLQPLTDTGCSAIYGE